MTSLILYATRFDQVLDIIKRRRIEVSLFLLDTQGQMETFMGSASSMIMDGVIAITLRTVAVLVVNTWLASAPMAFVSNMLYASLIFYKTHFLLAVLFRKTDGANAEKLNNWMRDFWCIWSGSWRRKVCRQRRSQFHIGAGLVSYSHPHCIRKRANSCLHAQNSRCALRSMRPVYKKENRPILEVRLPKRASENSQKCKKTLIA